MTSYDDWKLDNPYDMDPGMDSDEVESARIETAEARIDELRDLGFTYDEIINGRLWNSNRE